MSRVAIEYFKAGLMGVLAVGTAILAVVGDSPPAYAAFPVIFALLALYFCWKADIFAKKDR